MIVNKDMFLTGKNISVEFEEMTYSLKVFTGGTLHSIIKVTEHMMKFRWCVVDGKDNIIGSADGCNYDYYDPTIALHDAKLFIRKHIRGKANE